MSPAPSLAQKKANPNKNQKNLWTKEILKVHILKKRTICFGFSGCFLGFCFNSSSETYSTRLFQKNFWPKPHKLFKIHPQCQQERDVLNESECSVSFLYVTTRGVFPVHRQAVLIPVLESLDMLVEQPVLPDPSCSDSFCRGDLFMEM